MIGKRELPASFEVQRVQRVFSGGQEDGDGNVKKPVFKRSSYDFPGAQSRTES